MKINYIIKLVSDLIQKEFFTRKQKLENKLEIKKSLNIINENKSVDEMINLLHKELEGMSFSTKKILGLRDKFLNIKLNSSNQLQL